MVQVLHRETGHRARISLLFRQRSIATQAIADLFQGIGKEIMELEKYQPEIRKHPGLMKGHIPFMGELLLGHLRYGTQGKNNV